MNEEKFMIFFAQELAHWFFEPMLVLWNGSVSRIVQRFSSYEENGGSWGQNRLTLRIYSALRVVGDAWIIYTSCPTARAWTFEVSSNLDPETDPGYSRSGRGFDFVTSNSRHLLRCRYSFQFCSLTRLCLSSLTKQSYFARFFLSFLAKYLSKQMDFLSRSLSLSLTRLSLGKSHRVLNWR